MLGNIQDKLLIKYQNRLNEFIVNNSPFQIEIKSKHSESITKLKGLQNNLEDSYISFMKNIAKIIIKPKDLIRRNNSLR